MIIQKNRLYRLIGKVVLLVVAVAPSLAKDAFFSFELCSAEKSQELLKAAQLGSEYASDGTMIMRSYLTSDSNDYALLVIHCYKREEGGRLSKRNQNIGVRELKLKNLDESYSEGSKSINNVSICYPIWVNKTMPDRNHSMFYIGARVQFGPEYMEQIIKIPDTVRATEVYEVNVIIDDPFKKKVWEEKIREQREDEVEKKEREKASLQHKKMLKSALLLEREGVNVYFEETVPIEGDGVNPAGITYSDGSNMYKQLFFLWAKETDESFRYSHNESICFPAGLNLGGDLSAWWIDSLGERHIAIVENIQDRSIRLPKDATYLFKESSFVEISLNCESVMNKERVGILGFYLSEKDKVGVCHLNLRWEEKFRKGDEYRDLLKINARKRV